MLQKLQLFEVFKLVVIPAIMRPLKPHKDHLNPKVHSREVKRFGGYMSGLKINTILAAFCK